ncbi:MAG TPA: M15 family metallopeptidase, partial [Acidimicrobiales bacterium]|nr:M15 family metallopeptidase [Acidimicrobiales bacterium]
MTRVRQEATPGPLGWVAGAAALAALAALLAACRGTTRPAGATAAGVTLPAAASATTTVTTALATTASTAPRPAASPATATPTTLPVTTTSPVGLTGFASSVAPITAADVPYSWRPGCPLAPDQLRKMQLSYWGFDNQPHLGTMIVNAAVTADVAKIFGALFAEHFPIFQMQPVDAYKGSDPASMAANNTSGFNCRDAVGAASPQWSVHAFGEAIDVNTVENPYIEGGTVMPDAGRAYLDRANYRPGMAVPGGQLVKAFASAGWQWGGRW